MKKHTSVSRYTGFTVIEMMIALVIVGILVSVGLPQLTDFMDRNRLVSASNEMVSAFHVARSEAIKLNTRVSICESSDGSSCDASGDWSDGWIVFIDSDGDLGNTGAPCANAATDCLLRIHDGFDTARFNISGLDDNAVAASAFTFTSRGVPKAVNGDEESGVFSICIYDNDDNVTDSRAVVLSLSGRVRITSNDAVINCAAAP